MNAVWSYGLGNQFTIPGKRERISWDMETELIVSLLRFCYIELQFRLHNPLQTRGEGLTRTTIKIISHQLLVSSSLLASLFYLHEMYFSVANSLSDPKFILYFQVEDLCLHQLQCKGLAILIVNQTSKIFACIYSCFFVFLFFSSSFVYSLYI